MPTEKIRETIHKMTKLYTDLLDNNDSTGRKGLYREAANILGVAINKLELLRHKQEV